LLGEDVLAGGLWHENKEITNSPYSAIKPGSIA